MTTNRPFMTNFFAAFRAHSAIQQVAKTNTTGTTTPAAAAASYTPTSSLHTTTSNTASPNASSSPRPISKSGAPVGGSTTAAVQATGQFHATRQHAPSPYSRSPSSPGVSGFPLKSPSAKERRGSDSSSEGFRDAMGPDKWYIGGRTANGEEKFYRLGVVKRNRSIDRLSMDRLSI